MTTKQQHTLLNILLVDDDIDDIYFFDIALKELPVSAHLTIVNDGEQLMNYLSENLEHLPDILFLDLNMPRKNGFECLEEIRLIEKLKHLPIIIFSTSFEQGVVNILYKNGAQYFIRKPSDFSQFKKLIHQSLIFVLQGNISQPTREKFVLTIENS
ncbi:CheY-like chemotaxis protein [Flavobacterium sp. 1]|uniref:response regulator n=1 Tax=Flavobacterium sp. 1 TaxID=2035200 RepID=UPI000C24FEFB|nr:response regulator [Flavobacterium sp. 1]PJJ07004.1 CheY-like chemotaxis protein [Flavobacterium sp. 1]